jgi:hypothetical protein
MNNLARPGACTVDDLWWLETANRAIVSRNSAVYYLHICCEIGSKYLVH